MVSATPIPNDGASSSGSNTAATGSATENGGQQSSARSRSLGAEKKPAKSFTKTAEELRATALQMARNVMINMGLVGKEGTPHLEASVSADIARGGGVDASKIVATVVQNAQKVFGDLVTQQGLFATKHLNDVSLCTLSPNHGMVKQPQVSPTLPA